MPVGAYNQLATYWGNGVIGGTGKRTFGTPISLYVRWEDKLQMVPSPKGEDIPSRSTVYTDHVLEIGGYLALGDYTGVSPILDPTTIDAAYRIVYKDSMVSVDGLEYVRKAYLN